jgi:integrase
MFEAIFRNLDDTLSKDADCSKCAGLHWTDQLGAVLKGFDAIYSGLNCTFRRLMRDMDMLKNEERQTRTLYSLRHIYATFELLRNSTDIHTLSKQMGNSAAMIEKNYSKITATMVADKLA